jgi:hypothetical protein
MAGADFAVLKTRLPLLPCTDHAATHAATHGFETLGASSGRAQPPQDECEMQKAELPGTQHDSHHRGVDSIPHDHFADLG